MRALLLIWLFLAAVLNGENISSYQILTLAKNGKAAQAIDLYRNLYLQTQRHDMQLLRELGLFIIAEGAASPQPETELLALFGAGISTNEQAIIYLEQGLSSKIPQLQLVALNFLSRIQNDRADAALKAAFRSNYLPIRLEAAYILSEKKDPSASGQAEALMYKVDNVLLPLFPPIFAEAGDQKALRNLKKLLSHSSEDVRISAVHSSAAAKRDDLLPQIRRIASQHGMAQQEAAAYALGVLKDDSSIDLLNRLSRERSQEVCLAALLSLDKLGIHESRQKIFDSAEGGDLFAIASLGKIDGTEDLLCRLMESQDSDIRLNAALSLLERRDPRCLKGVVEILIRDERGFAFTAKSSHGHSLKYWKVVPSAQYNLKDSPIEIELSLAMREETLVKAAELPEKEFLALARFIFFQRQNDLVPVLVRLLENIQSLDAVALLKEGSQQLGAPLIRNYCNLALYKLKEEGPYYENLKHWIAKEQGEDLIRFRPMVPRKQGGFHSKYELTPQETSRLLIEAFESFARMQDDRGIEILLHAIRYGNSTNKYALAGLLIFATL